MGNWNITIRGTGVHHNKALAEDADKMAAKFVEDLKAKGHTIIAASITAGFENDLSDPAKYLADRETLAGK